MKSIVVFVLAACAAFSQAAPAAARDSACRLCALKISAGMARAEVEAKVAAALGQQDQYSPYVNNLRGGLVVYKDGAARLRVPYLPGSPAPTVINAQGVGEHMQPIDETVGTVELIPGRAYK
jgi:hypothetical protein